ncbi:endo alpha-1,4 polygalactosaminidase [Paraburkholderia sp. BL9I2N2]|uniref:endo alpha-1,4 polygalactosaminidase n=1 Tax=Paraburkholderia sp. BL9I2N2 TaxID=1938809 RepID=UPI001FB224E2|nr:endo alpha-1,4 polygalactosaminidase [Paraburkholderia sp. BL9I2N2]
MPASPVWAVYYGQGSAINIAHAAATFKLIVIDADLGNGTPAFSAVQIAALKANGAKVLSYLNFGACEKSRTYWNTVPSSFVSCGANTSAQNQQIFGLPGILDESRQRRLSEPDRQLHRAASRGYRCRRIHAG